MVFNNSLELFVCLKAPENCYAIEHQKSNIQVENNILALSHFSRNGTFRHEILFLKPKTEAYAKGECILEAH
jgi:hypothetical protein